MPGYQTVLARFWLSREVVARRIFWEFLISEPPSHCPTLSRFRNSKEI